MPKTFTCDWFSHNIPIWNKYLSEFKDRYIEVLEIGCFEGKATCWFLENLIGHITCIDSFEGEEFANKLGVSIDGLKDRFLENVDSKRVTLFEGRSNVILRSMLSGSFDLIYVDGSHYASDVLMDLYESLRLLHNGGILIADDYGWDIDPCVERRPKAAIDFFLAAASVTVLHLGYQAILKKI